MRLPRGTAAAKQLIRSSLVQMFSGPQELPWRPGTPWRQAPPAPVDRDSPPGHRPLGWPLSSCDYGA